MGLLILKWVLVIIYMLLGALNLRSAVLCLNAKRYLAYGFNIMVVGLMIIMMAKCIMTM